jgi:hypothetical protein
MNDDGGGAPLGRVLQLCARRRRRKGRRAAAPTNPACRREDAGAIDCARRLETRGAESYRWRKVAARD